MQTCTPLNAINGFRKTGIFPYDPDVFIDIAFATAEVTEQNEPQNDNVHVRNEVVHEQNEKVNDKNNVVHAQNDETNVKSRPSESNEQNDALPTIVTQSLASVNEGSTSKASIGFNILPNYIHPLPNMTQEQPSSKLRKSGGTVVLTSTPYKDQLLEEQQKKEKQVEKKASKNKKKLAGKTGLKEKHKRQSVCDDKESEVEDDTECFICTETLLQSHSGEGWVQCSTCYRWAHDECVGIDENDCDPYCCAYCIDHAKV